MLLLLRKLKHDRLMKKKTRKYVVYAIGEVFLIIAGIMIALQIDNWNTDRQQRALLESYLQSIARNMHEDEGELQLLRTTRRARTIDVNRMFMLIGRNDYTYDVAEIFFFNRVASEASENLNFRADTSGYEALKSSDVMSLLQGNDIERVLSKYYAQVDHIDDLEQLQNETINQLYLQYIMSFPDDIPQWIFRDPRSFPPEIFQELQPELAKIINGPAIRELISLQLLGSLIVREYDRLELLGSMFIDMVESGNASFANPEVETLLVRDSLADPETYADIVVDGVLSTQIYYISGVADRFEPVFDFRFISQDDNGLRISYPGSDSWAAVFLLIWGVADDRVALDYSQFDKLVIELKGNEAGQTLSIILKDLFLPDTAPPDSIELELDDSWKTYEFDLARFSNTDLSNLITPLGFAFEKEPQSFYIKNARFVRSD